MGISEHDAIVQRIILALGRFTLLKRELNWLRNHEPIEYQKVLDELYKATRDNN